MDYSAHMIARAEHKQMTGSLRPVSEFGEHTVVVVSQPGWLSRQAGRLLSSLGNGLAAQGRRMNPRHSAELNVSLAE